MKNIVLVKYRNREEFEALKLPTSFPDYETHEAALANAVADFAKRGITAEIQEIDPAEYLAFLARNGARHTSANVAAFATLKHQGKEQKAHPELIHEQVEVQR